MAVVLEYIVVFLVIAHMPLIVDGLMCAVDFVIERWVL